MAKFSIGLRIKYYLKLLYGIALLFTLMQVLYLFMPSTTKRFLKMHRNSLSSSPVFDNLTQTEGLNKSIYSNCQVIHIGAKCFYDEELHSCIMMMKSVLYHSQSAIKFHFLTNEAGKNLLKTFIETWTLHHVDVTFYTVTSDIPVIYYLMKNPPGYVNVLILIRSKVTLEADIVKFSDIINSQENSDYALMMLDSHYDTVHQMTYIPHTFKPDYHSMQGLVLRFSVITRNGLCTEVNQIDKGQVRPDIQYVYSVRCINRAIQGSKIIASLPRITSPGLLDQNQLDVYQTSYPESFLQMVKSSGDSLRDRTVHVDCNWIYTKSDNKVYMHKDNQSETCYDYIHQALSSRRMHLYFNGIDHFKSAMRHPEHFDVTIVTQLQYNRLKVLLKLIESWKGPMQIVMYLTDEEAFRFESDLKTKKLLKSRSNIRIHVVYKRHTYYPINFLRNIGLNETRTSHVFVMDVDFIPMPRLYDKLLGVVHYLNAQHAPNTDWCEVIKELSRYSQSNSSYKLGHEGHNYNIWMTAKDPYKVKFTPTFEPYILLPTDQSPKYQEIMLERMMDKFPYTLEVALKQLPMYVLPDAYIVHFPHPKSDSWTWYDQKLFLQCANYLYDNIQNELSKTYPDNSQLKKVKTWMKSRKKKKH